MLFLLEKTRVKPGTVLIETVLSGDSLYIHTAFCVIFSESLKKELEEISCTVVTTTLIQISRTFLFWLLLQN